MKRKLVGLATAVVSGVILVISLRQLSRSSGLSAPPLHHTTNLTADSVDMLKTCITEGACATAFEHCSQDVECSAVVAEDWLTRSLQQRRKLPLLPRNAMMRALTACANAHCFVRRCTSPQARVATHVGCSDPPCYLTNDLVRTDSAVACQARCEAHAPPVYPELCGSYTWISKARLDDRASRDTCFLVGQSLSRKRVAMRGAVSGYCTGGPSGDALGEGVCERATSDVKYLKAWLRAKRRIKLKDADLDDLFHYMSLVGMCPNDIDFDETLYAFKDREPHEVHNPGIFKLMVATIVDIFEAIVDLVSRINPSVLLAMAVPLITYFSKTFPKLFSLFSPLVDHILAHHGAEDKNKKKKKGKNDDDDDNDDEDEGGDAPSRKKKDA